MSGSISLRTDVSEPRWVISFDWEGKRRKISRYKGRLMYQTHPTNTKKDRGYKTASKLLGNMQSDVDRGVFRIEKYQKTGWTDIVEYYNQWIKDEIEPGRKPATIKNYKSYGRTWIDPFFSQKNLMLHEIKADTLQEFLNYVLVGLKKKNFKGSPHTDLILKIHRADPSLSGAAIQRKILENHKIKMSPSWVRRVVAKSKTDHPTGIVEEKNIGKTAINILSAFHAMMDYAHRAERLFTVPPFPKKENYKLKPKKIDYLSPEDFYKITVQIPAEHLPIFQFLKLHFRRPGEACALHKSDYDQVNGVFTIHRAISARQLVDSVKTNWKNQKLHLIDCDEDFLQTARKLVDENQDSPFFFVNPRARNKGGRYTLESMRNVWYAACDVAGIRRIWPYRGTKHTACMEFLENGGSDDELMMLTDHANRESINAYREITLNRKRQARAAAKKRAKEREESAQIVAMPNNVVNLFEK